MIFKKMTAPNGHWPCNQENFAGTFDKDFDLIMTSPDHPCFQGIGMGGNKARFSRHVMKPEGRGRIRWQGQIAERQKHADQAAFFTLLGYRVGWRTCSIEAKVMHSPLPANGRGIGQ